MSSNSEHHTSSEPQSEQDLLALVVRMQQQLTAMEKKIDALMVQLEEKQASRGNTYSSPKPFRPYGQSSHGEGRRDRGPRDRNFGGPRRSFGDRNDRPQGEGRRDFGGGSGERSFGAPRSFDRQDRPQGGGGFGGPRKKPFFKRRRDRD